MLLGWGSQSLVSRLDEASPGLNEELLKSTMGTEHAAHIFNTRQISVQMHRTAFSSVDLIGEAQLVHDSVKTGEDLHI